jgi:hypothetical protein
MDNFQTHHSLFNLKNTFKRVAHNNGRPGDQTRPNHRTRAVQTRLNVLLQKKKEQTKHVQTHHQQAC